MAIRGSIYQAHGSVTLDDAARSVDGTETSVTMGIFLEGSQEFTRRDGRGISNCLSSWSPI